MTGAMVRLDDIEFSMRWILPTKDKDGFWLATTCVTQALWKKVMEGSNPSHFKGDDELPVESVSWHDCQNFIARLRDWKTEPKRWRLPTEAEWEYACRAGGAGCDAKLDDCAWYLDNSEERTHPVGQKRSNAWGFYDMLGNLWEWCEDEWRTGEKPADTYPRRVIRGRSWRSASKFIHCAARDWYYPDNRDDHIGFRLAASEEVR